MDRIILKQTLHEQAIPLADAVAKKLAYLQSDEVFTEAANAGNPTAMDDFTSAFGGLTASAPQPVATPTRPQATAVPQPAPEVDATPADPKQHIRDRIAQLRGINSMPGGYLKKL